MRVDDFEIDLLQNGHAKIIGTGPRVESTKLPLSGLSQRPRQSKCAGRLQHKV